MDFVHQLLVPIHLIAGFAALGLFWVPALTKKGGPTHRFAGRWYVRAMTVICLTGFALAFRFMAIGRLEIGLFLCFLGVITGTSLWNGWRALRAKRTPGAYLNRAHTAVALLNVLGGLGMIAFGIRLGVPLFYSFGPVGLVIGGGMLARLRRGADDPKYWLYEHFGGMIGSGIASHVAFLAFGGRQLFGWSGLSGAGTFLWLSPVVAGVTAITVLNFYYRRKPAPLAVPATN